jgi:nitrile hydratase
LVDLADPLWPYLTSQKEPKPMPHDHDHPHSLLPSDPELRVRAMESILVEKGLVDPAALNALIDAYENQIGPRNGAMVVAKSWVDPDYKKRLLNDATAAIAEIGFQGRQSEHMVAVENTASVHNIVVCTLWSCYPWAVLGIPPSWYKSDAYRSRTVREPRAVLAEFGVSLLAEQKVQVWDSTAEIRYLVLPMRPVGTEGWNVDRLAALVGRNAMIGTALADAPKADS